MKDDDFSGIVRSGAKHSVSVSERTGNAKTPKNIVVSHEEETEKRKIAFEQHELDALDIEKPLTDEEAANLSTAFSAGKPKANVQKVEAVNDGQNRQALATHAPAAENIQTLQQDSAEANRQKVGKNSTSANIQAINAAKTNQANRQDIPTDNLAANIQEIAAASVMAANTQEIGIEVTAANRQAIAAEKGIEANVQNIPVGAIAANPQKLNSQAVAANKQDIPSNKAIDANRQEIPTDVVAKNLQDIPVGAIAANQQSLGKAARPGNQQAAPEDAVDTNLQTLDVDTSGANLQEIPQDSQAPNPQTLERPRDNENRQGITGNPQAANDQKLAATEPIHHVEPLSEKAADANNQTLAAAPNIDPNHQPIETDAPILNRQAAPEDAPPGPNRQGVEHGKIEDHFETLPSEEIVREKVDFASPINTPPSSAATPSTALPKKKNARPLTRQTPTRPALSAEELHAIKVKREKMMEEFHGRVAGIKHNVDALNDRLTDFEERVHREDANLLKGDPNGFKVDLG